jgi:glyoxylase-like metal-dependent hydrolase (beta-lactamase superfamily II)
MSLAKRLGVCVVVLASGAAVFAQAKESAPALIGLAMEAMGGEATLTGVKALSLEVMGHQWALEQSERPEGPWLSMYQQRSEVRDLAGRRRTVKVQRRDWNFPDWSPASTTVVSSGVAARTNGTRWAGGAPGDVAEYDDVLALAPERLLFTARAASDLKRLPDEVHQGVTQHVLGFSRGAQRHRLFLNAWTHLPTMFETVRDDNFSIWGDVTERRWFSFWTLEAGGLMYPRQTTMEWNGLPYSDFTVQGLKVNPALDDATFQIPAEAQAQFTQFASRPTGMLSATVDETKVVAVTDWITQVPGGFNVAFIKQPDGLVVFEATTTSKYSTEVMALAAKRYPGVPIKAVVTTSDAWPHFGGIREYVAKKIPVYALDLNVPIVSRLVRAPRTIAPDTLAGAPQPLKVTPVSKRMTIGTGDTRIELFPVRGETGERMMLAWLPGAKVLYSSDLIQPGRPGTDTFFMPMMLAEVEAAVRREGITGVERVFGMHLAPRPWADVLAAIAAAK